VTDEATDETLPTRRKTLVMGASGFLGSHVVRQLVARGDDVRVLLRESSSTKGIDDLTVERHYGDIFDEAAVREAMADRDVVFYCVVDTRAWLRDPAPLFRTNVDGLRHVLDIAKDAGLDRFVFTSTIGTVALGHDGRAATEDDAFNWEGLGGGYIASRRRAEQLVMDYVANHGLPAVAMCVSNTYGPLDWQPTPHGGLLAMAAQGRVPVYIKGIGSEVVGVEDAAAALLLAAERGRVGERYIVSDRFLAARELYGIAAEAVGAEPPRFGVPIPLVYAAGFVGDLVGKLTRRDYELGTTSVRLLHHTSPLDHSKATRELGWQPEPVADSIRKAAQFFIARRKAKAGGSSE
jgi:dihydroflavonol-4-reductase